MEIINQLSAKGKIILAAAIFVVFMVIASIIIYLNSRHTLTVITDTIPITLKLNDTKRVLKSKSSTLTLENTAYNYRISSPNRPTIAGTFNLTETKNHTIHVKYEAYEPARLKNTACKLNPDYCSLPLSDISASYFEDYSWAIVRSKTIESGLILSIDNRGDWKLMGYTGEDGYTPGTYPRSVEKEAY